MYAMHTLAIRGYQDTPVPHRFWRQDEQSEQLAILLPGLGYTCDMPLLYYPARLLLNLDADVLLVDYTYRREDFAALSGDGQASRLFADVEAACTVGLAQRPYRQVTLIGKSLGTLAMGHLFAAVAGLPRETRAVWLTPLLRVDSLRSRIEQCGRRSLFVIGDADAHYDPALLAQVEVATGGQSVVIAGADHSMEIDGDVLQSLDAVRRIMQAMQAFVRETPLP